MSTITLTIDSRLSNSSLIGLTVNKLASRVLSTEETWAVELSVVEAVNNVIKHAYREQPGHKIEVTLNIDRDAMIIEIRDSGLSIPEGLLENRDQSVFGFDPDKIESLPEGGMGIALIKQNMDGVSYIREPDRNIMTLSKKITPASEQTAESAC